MFVKIAEKFHGFEFMSVSTDRLNTAVQMARRDLRKQKTPLPKAVEGLSLSPSNRQQAQKAVNACSVERVNKQQRKGEMKKVGLRLNVQSLVVFIIKSHSCAHMHINKVTHAHTHTFLCVI